MASTTITATCACNNFKFSLVFSNNDIPIETAFCLCTSCRRRSGTFGTSYLPFPASASPPEIGDFSLTSYETSKSFTDYFCSICGAHTLSHRKVDQTWHLTTGICDKPEDVLRWTGCEYVGDTYDGGLSVWLGKIEDRGEGRKLKRWTTQIVGGELVQDGQLQHLPPSKLQDIKEDSILKAQCHCGGVRFQVTRPNSNSEKAYSPFPDLMVPFHKGRSAAANPKHETWFLRSNNTKYMAGTCSCTSCRQSLGFEIQTWAFIPKCNILHENGEPLGDFDNMGTLKKYHSSEGVEREFCGRCGATVFWHCEERPELIDVSVGLFDPEEGARVERWLDWWSGRVSFEELAVSRRLVRCLEDGLKEWSNKSSEV